MLKYAECFSPMIGVDYWLHNLTSFRMDQIYFLFRTHQRSLNISTAFTDVTRLVSVDLWTRSSEYKLVMLTSSNIELATMLSTHL